MRQFRICLVILALVFATIARPEEHNSTERLLRDLDVHICAEFLTAAIFFDTARKMDLEPGEMITLMLKKPEEMKARLRMALDRSSDKLAEVLFGFYVLDDEHDRRAMLRQCAEGKRKVWPPRVRD